MKKALKFLVIHCTDTPRGRNVTSKEIREWHTSPPPRGNGWKQVGYTDMIHLDGTIERLVENNEDDLVDPWEVTNGAAGYNSVSRHIVYVGGKGGDTRTDPQKAAMEKFVKDFHFRFPHVKIIGHNEISGKTCPCFNVQEWLEDIHIINR